MENAKTPQKILYKRYGPKKSIAIMTTGLYHTSKGGWNDSVFYKILDGSDKMHKNHASMIRYTSKGRAYFLCDGKREYLDEFSPRI